MSLKIKTRDESNIVKKILIYGLPGHGKSTFASKYCKDNNLNPVVLDIDDTNFTGDALADIDLSNDLKLYNSVKTTIKDIINSEYDTIIIDGLGSLLENLVSKAKGQKKFLDRSDRFNSIFNDLTKSGLNLIFIGQNDCNLEDYTDSLPNKSIIKINSIVNEIYYCVKDGENFTHSIDKFRKELSGGDLGKKQETNTNNTKSDSINKTEEQPITDVTPPNSELEIEQEQTISKNEIDNEAINRLIEKKETITKDALVDEVRDMLGEKVISPAEAGKAQKVIANA